eukprot:c28497_g1_i1 orf=434-4474(+)
MDAHVEAENNLSFGEGADGCMSHQAGSFVHNSRPPRRERASRDPGLHERATTDRSFRGRGVTLGYQRPSDQERSHLRMSNTGFRSSRGHSDSFRNNQTRWVPSEARPHAAQARNSLSQDYVMQDTHLTGRGMGLGSDFPPQDFRRMDRSELPSQDVRRMDTTALDGPLSYRQLHRVEDLSFQDMRRSDQFSTPGYANPSQQLRVQHRNNAGRSQWNETDVHERERDSRRGGEQRQHGRRSGGFEDNQRSFERSISRHVEASTEAVGEALGGLSVTSDRGRDLSETQRENARNQFERNPTQRERWRRRPGTSFVTRGFSGDGHNHSGEITAAVLKSTEDMANEKPSIPKLVQELEEKLARSKVECMICYDMVNRTAATWSCQSCYSIFHLPCIKKWARAPSSVDASVPVSGEATIGSNWRCPGCQSVQVVSADELQYRCFCGQVIDPSVDYYLTPHSCGGPCRKPLNKGKINHCKHVCTMQCHPGPCPPCVSLCPAQPCPCGKCNYTRRCSDQQITASCGLPCGRQLQCGRHYCEKICHQGECGQCNELVTAVCFCGRKEEEVLCGSMGLQGDVECDKVVFSCGSICWKVLDCGKHKCAKKCHPGQCGDCELAPWNIQTCPCGKRMLHELLENGKGRKSCSDPVPVCGQVCGKLLPCGKHTCQSLCHSGSCPPCPVLVEQKCRCEASVQTVPCYTTLYSEADSTEMNHEEGESARELFLCNRKCGKKKDCGRHRCNNQCCPLADGCSALHGWESDPHRCLLTCGKRLRCGQHSCQDRCHNGHCPPCMETIFTELTCACGRTSIPPPVPCGTLPPSCQFPCTAIQPCGHALTTHTCHFGECPPCTVPTVKECVGNHVILRNVPCGSRDIKCNKLCGKTRECGLHACARTCHLPPCHTPSATDGSVGVRSCGQPCGAPRRDCQHTCTAPCHPSTTCPETRCKFIVKITCSCGRLSTEVPCDAGDLGRGDAIAEAAIVAKLPAPLQPVEGKVRVPLGQRKLACDDECAKLGRKRILAEAFGINTATDSIPTMEGGMVVSEALAEMARREPQWLMSIEDRFRYLVLGSKVPTPVPIRVHVFCPLPKEKRELVRQLAERWNLNVNAVGREPKRVLTVHVSSKSKAPARSLMGRAPIPLAGQAHPPAFNATLDMDPKLVVGLFELPREADINTLILRFGGECELVWLNDKNALAIFADVARASTALRRVECASAYHGAVVMPSVSGSASHSYGANETVTSSKGALRRKHVHDSSWVEDAWGEDRRQSSEQIKTVWNKGTGITATKNPWGALEQDDKGQDLGSGSFTSSLPAMSVAVTSSPKAKSREANNENMVKDFGPSHVMDAADDWEEAFS